MKRMSAFIALLFVIMLVACSDNNPVGPSNQPESGNNPDNFQFQASSLSRTTQTFTSSWTNTGVIANVNHSGRVDGGEATLVLRDASGN